MWRHDGARSDGYLAHIFRHAAKELFHEDVGEVTYRTLRSVGAGRVSRRGPGWEPLEGDKFKGALHRNRDLQEVTLERDGRVLLRFAAAYGFRNIQNVVLKLKRGKAPYHLVEVLACPGGRCTLGPEGRNPSPGQWREHPNP